MQSPAKPFRGRLGFDANDDKVINVADPSEPQDGVNLRFLIGNNTVQPFDSDRLYPYGFIIEHNDRLYKSKRELSAGVFDLDDWTEIHAFGQWTFIQGDYTAIPGDYLVVSAGTTITLPDPESGDYVAIRGVDAAFLPIVVQSANTINGESTDYAINSDDFIEFIYVGGTWKVFRNKQVTHNYINSDVELKPNSYNIVDTSTRRSLDLPTDPINGQYVVVVDGLGRANIENITVGDYIIKTNGEQVIFVYDELNSSWIVSSSKAQNKLYEAGVVELNQVKLVSNDIAREFSLPQQPTSGDWVEFVVYGKGNETIKINGSVNIQNNRVGYINLTKKCRAMFVYSTIDSTNVGWVATITTDNGDFGGDKTGAWVANRNTHYIATAPATISLPSINSVELGDWVELTIRNTLDVPVQVSTTNATVNGRVSFDKTYNDVTVKYVVVGTGTNVTWESIELSAGYMKKADNFAGLADIEIARDNIDVYSRGESDSRFLGIEANAVSATQADNADKLDNLDSSDFVQVKNLVVDIVDADTTSETRFTTNINTPTTDMWHVVTFIDATTGNKAQLGLALTTNRIAYRSYSGSWSTWTRLDQAANAATASKLLNAINITLTGDVNGSVLADLSGDVEIQTVVNSEDVNLVDLSGDYASIPSGVFADKVGDVTRFVSKDGVGTGFIIDVSPDGEVSMMSWDGNTWVNNRVFTDSHHPNADKWTNPITLTLTGGLNGEATIDGSGDIELATTVDAGAHTHEISHVDGLQSALDGKVSVTGTAYNSERLGGLGHHVYGRSVVVSDVSIDPNETNVALILTDHENGPDGGDSYWYIETKYHLSRDPSANKFQMAYSYNDGAAIRFRQFYGNVWGEWIGVSAIATGSTYDINISGNATTATSAGKLTTPVRINNVEFDGSADITIVDGTKINKSGDVITGKITTGTQSTKDAGIYGSFDGTNKVDHIWSISTTYKISASGSTFGSLYGIAHKHSSTPAGGDMVNGHQIVYTENGTPGVSIGLSGDIWHSGVLKSGGIHFNGSPVSITQTTDNSRVSINTEYGSTVIGMANASYSHYNTSSTGGHYFFGDVTTNGTLRGAVEASSVNASILTLPNLSVEGSNFHLNGWLRTYGPNGWYSTDFGGGIHMSDVTWVRIYGSKALYVANQIAATGNITAYYSDKRLKTNVRQIKNAVDTVKKWTGYHYTANDIAAKHGYNPDKPEIGLMAQDVQLTTPEAVEPAPFDLTAVEGKSLTGQHYLTLKYERLVPILVEAIKEQDAEIQALKDQVAKLFELIGK